MYTAHESNTEVDLRRPDNLPDFGTPPLVEVVLGVQFATPAGYREVFAREVWALGEAFDGGDGARTNLDREEIAGEHRLLVDEDSAGATFAAVAGALGAGEVEALAQDVQERVPELDVQALRLAVYIEVDTGA